MRAGWGLPSFHSPMSPPLAGYFFTWTRRHRVSELEGGCSLGRWGGAQRAGLERPAPSFLPPHIGAFLPFLPTGTAGLTPSPPSGSLTSSTSVPMRECHPSKGGAEDGNKLGEGVYVSCGPRPVLSCQLHPAAWAQGSGKCRFQPSVPQSL